MRTKRRRRRSLQVGIISPSRARSNPNPQIQASRKNVLLANTEDNRVANLGFPGSPVDGQMSDSRSEVDGGIVNLVAVSGTAAPENVQRAIQDGEIGEIGRASEVAARVDRLAGGRGPVDAVVGRREPDEVGMVSASELIQPRQVELPIVFLENWSRGGLEACSNEDGPRIPVPCAVGALVPDAGVGSLGFPRNVKAAFEPAEGRRMVALGTNLGVGREIVFMVSIRGRVLGSAYPEENAISGSAVREPQLSVPEVR